MDRLDVLDAPARMVRLDEFVVPDGLPFSPVVYRAENGREYVWIGGGDDPEALVAEAEAARA